MHRRAGIPAPVGLPLFVPFFRAAEEERYGGVHSCGDEAIEGTIDESIAGRMTSAIDVKE